MRPIFLYKSNLLSISSGDDSPFHVYRDNNGVDDDALYAESVASSLPNNIDGCGRNMKTAVLIWKLRHFRRKKNHKSSTDGPPYRVLGLISFTFPDRDLSILAGSCSSDAIKKNQVRVTRNLYFIDVYIERREKGNDNEGLIK